MLVSRRQWAFYQHDNGNRMSRLMIAENGWGGAQSRPRTLQLQNEPLFSLAKGRAWDSLVWLPASCLPHSFAKGTAYWEGNWLKLTMKKMKKNESSSQGNVPEACHSRIIRPWWEEWKAVSLSDSRGFGFLLLFLFCFVFSKIWFRGKMWPLKTNTNYASISFKYINTKTKRKDPRVGKNACHLIGDYFLFICKRPGMINICPNPKERVLS